MMEQKSMTALVSAFSRAYHSDNNEVKIFNDSLAKQMLSEEEYNQISQSMANGISFFSPNFIGEPPQALRWVVDNQLSPTPLGRAVFSEKSLERAVRIGARQYLILGSGYDTFAHRQPSWASGLQIFELEHPTTLQDKQERLRARGLEIQSNVHHLGVDFTQGHWQKALTNHPAFDKNKISFVAILGVVYYLSVQDFETMISVLSGIVPKGSSIIFDYPDENSYTDKAGERAKKQAMLAGAANEKMLASYSYADMESLLSAHDFLIYEHLTPQEITKQYFSDYNKSNPNHIITAFDNVNYCLAVKR